MNQRRRRRDAAAAATVAAAGNHQFPGNHGKYTRFGITFTHTHIKYKFK